MNNPLAKLCRPAHRPLTPALQQAAEPFLPADKLHLLDDSFELYWYFQENPNAVLPESVAAWIAPRKTLLNRIGEIASYGTECTCCLGYRIWIALFVGIGVGIWIE